MSSARLALLAGIAVSACSPFGWGRSKTPAPAKPSAQVSAPRAASQPRTTSTPAPRTTSAAVKDTSPARSESRQEPARVVTPPPDDTASVSDTMYVTRITRESARETLRDTTAIKVSRDSLKEIVEAMREKNDAKPSLAIDDYAGHERVEHYLRLFAGTASTRIGERLSAGTRYDAMIRTKLRAGGIPEDFRYLALIESGYNPDAYSRAAAVGMWQFMTTTAKGAGLRVDWWVDERRDPVRSTDAAVRFLNGLRQQFGSYYLAAAAYNGGPGRISRGLSRLAEELDDVEPEDKFFTLASSSVLRAETRNYVPQIIAAALIGRDPRAYGMTIEKLPPFVYDSAQVPPGTSLHAIAKACRTDVPDVVDLNRHVLRGMTPPEGPSMYVRMPQKCAASFTLAFASLDSVVRFGSTARKTKKGETPASIAKKAGITVAQLRVYNPKVKYAMNAAIPTGTRVLVPTKEAVRAARDVPDPSIERYGVATNGVYVVRRGDTLSEIAARHDTTVATLKRLNRLSSDKINVGQRLKLNR